MSADKEALAILDAAVAATPHGQAREGQREMCAAVANAVDSGKHLLVQAGTGTGKSLAYLCAALAAGKPVVVSTATLALQHQLVAVDLPRLVEAVAPVLGRKPSFALLKGRHNYICKRKIAGEEEDDDGAIEGTEQLKWAGRQASFAKQVQRLFDWANDTDTGDRDDLDPGVSDRAWKQASTSSSECPGAKDCAQGSDCFAEWARARAHEADIVVTNHALLSIDMMNERSVLPEHAVLIIDEAHELVDRVTAAARAELHPARLRWLAQRGRRLIDAEVADELREAADALEGALTAAGERRFTGELPGPLVEALNLVNGACVKATTHLGSLDSETKKQLSAQQLKAGLVETIETAGRCVGPAGDDVIWSEPNGPQLVAAPLSVGGLLSAMLYEDRTVIAASATLTLGGRFDIVARNLGLPVDKPDKKKAGKSDAASGEGERSEGASGVGWSSLDVGSPFDYRKQGILYVAASLPRPTASGLSEEAGKEMLRLVEASRGATLGLFSSKRAAESAAELLRAQTDFDILLQGEETLGSLVKRFKEEESTCLLGVMSLWQGVDVPGMTCRLVVVDRIPFPRPTEPLTAARSEAADAAGRSGFAEVSVPAAAIRLAQGAGRLIRRTSDRGVVAILDSRLETSRSYGRFLRDSLPPFWYTTKSDSVIGALGRLAETGVE
ncbi:ATP-dependent DNA helicase [Glycomyces sp. TRM65418]|uniref:ATP-dependent DNA helicase n=1 Tax=Glycomyces sp. TRM65418 TaxID=2867006 RepID=UPI001CE5A742|nr:ATP-dependent DNA helicase [Glycomyces sp. TRM65418]MCC3763875.1 ATP-dependent DNA helicase [Glycomyces sp. TRM65418]QZD53578.1 ATP-dependent DNA helicase [Glycomyces sp. TRM65418]